MLFQNFAIPHLEMESISFAHKPGQRLSDFLGKQNVAEVTLCDTQG